MERSGLSKTKSKMSSVSKEGCQQFRSHFNQEKIESVYKLEIFITIDSKVERVKIIKISIRHSETLIFCLFKVSGDYSYASYKKLGNFKLGNCTQKSTMFGI
jgi:hypothetical protein